MTKERLKIRSDPALVVLLPLGMTSFPLSIGKNRVFFNFHTCWPPENFHSSYYLMLGSWQVEMFNRFYRETMRSMDWWFMGAARTLGDTLVVGYALRFTTWCNIWLTVFLFAGWNKRFQWDPNGGMTPAKETTPPDPNPKKNGCPTWGLTGSIGMGKSTVSKWLQAKRAKKFALSLPCLFQVVWFFLYSSINPNSPNMFIWLVFENWLRILELPPTRSTFGTFWKRLCGFLLLPFDEDGF